MCDEAIYTVTLNSGVGKTIRINKKQVRVNYPPNFLYTKTKKKLKKGDYIKNFYIKSPRLRKYGLYL